MDVLINLTIVIISLCIRILKHHVVHFKYINFINKSIKYLKISFVYHSRCHTEAIRCGMFLIYIEKQTCLYFYCNGLDELSYISPFSHYCTSLSSQVFSLCILALTCRVNHILFLQNLLYYP